MDTNRHELISWTTDCTDYADVRLGSARVLACTFRRPRRNDLLFGFAGVKSVESLNRNVESREQLRKRLRLAGLFGAKRAMSFPAWGIAPWNFETPQRSAEGATQSGSGFQIVIRAFSAGHILFFNNPRALPQAALNTALLVD